MTSDLRSRIRAEAAVLRDLIGDNSSSNVLNEAADALEAAERDQPVFKGVALTKLNDLLKRGWDISGYAIHKDGEHGLVTTGAFVGWWTVASNNAATAERQRDEAIAKREAAEREKAELREALDAAAGELAEAADKFWVIHCNHPGDPPNRKMLHRRQDEDKEFLAVMSKRMTGASMSARSTLSRIEDKK